MHQELLEMESNDPMDPTGPMDPLELMDPHNFWQQVERLGKVGESVLMPFLHCV